MNNHLFNKIPTFDYKDIHGKKLLIHIEESESLVVISGFDANGVRYVLHCGKNNNKTKEKE